MTVKRRNHGRSRKGRGHCGTAIICDGCGSRPGKDKAVKRFQVRNIVDSSSMRDIRDASAYTNYVVPKMYLKMQYCVGCAVHRRVVRSRAAEARKIRTTAPRRPFGGPAGAGAPGGGAGAPGGGAK
jgi:small subunit ribosomal protein S26e